MYRFILLFLSSSIFIAACTSSGPSQKTFQTNESEIIKQLEYEAISAEFRLDTAYIASVIDDNFISVYAHKLQSKNQELAGIYSNITSRIKEGETMDSLYLDDFRSQFYDNTAIVTFYTVTKGRIKNEPYTNRRMRWYDVWVKQKDKWMLVASQGTPFIST